MKEYLDNMVPANEAGTLRVTVKRAWGLRAADPNGSSDPFVVVSTVKGQQKGRVVKRSLSPQWDETFEFEGVISDFVGVEHPLLIRIYDADDGNTYANREGLGDVKVVLPRQRSVQEFTEELPTQGHLEFSVAWAQPAAAKAEERGVLRLLLKRASGLLAADTGFLQSGKSDPYVVLTAANGASTRSQARRATLEPVWDEPLELEGTFGELTSAPLELAVYDADLVGKASLGAIQVDLSCLRDEAAKE
eukprot:2856363-Prymnesium_polylepis.1